MGIRMEDLDFKFMNKIGQINDMAKNITKLFEKSEEAEIRSDMLRQELKQMVEAVEKGVKSNTETLESRKDHGDRIVKLEELVRVLRVDLAQTQKDTAVDYDALCSKDEYLELNAKVTDMGVDVDTSKGKLTDFGLRIDELAESIKEPLGRISMMEERASAIETDLHNKVSNHDMYHQLAQKTSLEKSRSIE